jgi:starch synthase
MKIAMVSAEIGPFAKTGGLADVVQTLSIALERRGHELSLILPAYRYALKGDFSLEATALRFSVPLSHQRREAAILRGNLGKNILVYLVREDSFFDREFLYGTPGRDYQDNCERFVFFSRAALELLRLMPVDVLHCHDWQTAPAIVFLKAQSERYPELQSTRAVLTVHNLGFQGIFPQSDWHWLDLDRSLFAPQYLEFYDNINFLKGALVFADKITTVSPSYATEIMEAEQGFGLEGVLRERARDVVGILNGVDYGQWNPVTDPFITKRYGDRNLTAKRICKTSLQRALGLPEKGNVALIGMISRLTSQKGFDLLEDIFDALMDRELQIALLGNGETRYHEFWADAARHYPAKVAARFGFDDSMAHQIEAGADIFLMPSHYEPCGLNQMFSLKYGTIPIVRAVGGLKDTVKDYDAENGSGTGFVFGPYEALDLLATVDRALRVFRNKKAWTTLRRRAMSLDFSWDRSADAYHHLYLGCRANGYPRGGP